MCVPRFGFVPTSSHPFRLLQADLIQAVKNGDVDRVRQLVAQGVPVDRARGGSYQQSALGVAAEFGQVNVAAVLLELGADKDLENNNNGVTPLQLASWKNHPAVIDLLLCAGVDVEKTGAGQSTPLGIAAFYGYTAIVEKLLRAGADVNRTGALWLFGLKGAAAVLI